MADFDINFYFMRTFDIFMIFAPNLGFIAQIAKFRKLKSSEGFSKFLSFILLIANILRIFFWVGKRFSTPLLFQSIFSICMQMFILKECLRFAKYTGNKGNSEKNEKYKGKKDCPVSINHENMAIPVSNPYLYRPINILDLKHFWNWPYLIDYAYFLILFSLAVGFLSHVIGYDNAFYVEILGIVSASVEAVICIPQIITNCRTRSTASLSTVMIYIWVIGDSVKTFYFLKTQAPLQLICCGAFQLTTDLIIFFQILYYGKGDKEASEYDRIDKKELDTSVDSLEEVKLEIK